MTSPQGISLTVPAKCPQVGNETIAGALASLVLPPEKALVTAQHILVQRSGRFVITRLCLRDRQAVRSVERFQVVLSIHPEPPLVDVRVGI